MFFFIENCFESLNPTLIHRLKNDYNTKIWAFKLLKDHGISFLLTESNIFIKETNIKCMVSALLLPFRVKSSISNFTH